MISLYLVNRNQPFFVIGSDRIQVSPSVSADLLLPVDRQQELRSEGTWAELFPPTALQNRSELAAAVLWWLFLLALGWLIYPLLRLALPGLSDFGYPLARTAGLLLLSYPVWLLGSLQLPVTRGLIALALGGLALISLSVVWLDRRAFGEHLWQRRRYFFQVELIALAAFSAFLLVRWGNPDLWHVYFGGEKPMDFSYFNAVLKSETFPPYDPWFAGGVMNYYYYGFVLVGIPVKLLGITPAVAYNLILPSLFSLVFLGAFSIGWNLNQKRAWIAGFGAGLAVVVFGNLGAVRMVWDGWQKLVASETVITSATFFEKIQLALAGASQWIQGAALPYFPGDWYWMPSRAVIPAPNYEITEFPLFSFLYADPHAHLISLPITLLVMAWSLSAVLGRAQWGRIPRRIWALAFGALAVGVLRASNSWDHPTYLLFSSLALVYAEWTGVRYASPTLSKTRVLQAILELAFFIGLSFALLIPFNSSFRQGYTQIQPWQGSHVNLTSYLVHWGLFVFVLFIWLLGEIIDWMAHTPLSALQRAMSWRRGWIALTAFAGVAFFGLLIEGISAAWVVCPLGLACALLLFRGDQPASKRFALFMAGTGLALTLAVELIALQGDRMNTVFKFYFQAWTFLSLSAAAGFSWLLPRAAAWRPAWRSAFACALFTLVSGAMLTTATSAKSKIIDRMAGDAPHTLDGMAYMDSAVMFDGPAGSEGQYMILREDARAIHWMQQNVQGSPVIVEAHTPEYRHWGNRFTIYTGLPGVIGWEAHQRQQRATVAGDPVGERAGQVLTFYLTTDREQARAFLEQYGVEYIIVGQVERLFYPGPGLEKFQALAGDLWEPVYSEDATAIYRIIEQPGID